MNPNSESKSIVTATENKSIITATTPNKLTYSLPVNEPITIESGGVRLVYDYPQTTILQCENAREIFRHRCAQLATLMPSIAEARASGGYKFLSNCIAHIVRVEKKGTLSYDEDTAENYVRPLVQDCVVEWQPVLELVFRDFFCRQGFGSIVSEVLRGEHNPDMITRFLQMTAMNARSTTNSEE